MKYGLLFLVLLASLLGCNTEVKDSPKQIASGNPDGLVILMDQKLWGAGLGASVKALFGSTFPVLPQPESEFDLQRVDLQPFKRIVKFHHNILLCVVGSDGSDEGKFLSDMIDHNEQLRSLAKDASLRYFYGKDLWANGQLVTFILAEDEESFKKQLELHGADIVHRMHQFEFKRIKNHITGGSRNDEAAGLLKRRFDINAIIPSTFLIADSSSHIVWLRYELADVSLNIAVYADSLPHQAQRAAGIAFERRDRILGPFIGGATEGSYMTSDTSVLPFWTREIIMDNVNVTEVRGLWKMSKDFMGGPFISFAITQPTFKRYLIMEGFIYAPGEEKRKYLRQLEYLLSRMITSLNEPTKLAK